MLYLSTTETHKKLVAAAVDSGAAATLAVTAALAASTVLSNFMLAEVRFFGLNGVDQCLKVSLNFFALGVLLSTGFQYLRTVAVDHGAGILKSKWKLADFNSNVDSKSGVNMVPSQSQSPNALKAKEATPTQPASDAT